MRLTDCHNFGDFRRLAKKRLPSPVFHYIDGAADDEITYRRNTSSFDDVDLVPNVLAGVETVDMSVEVMGQKMDMPLYCAPTALQRLFHYEGERAVARAATKHGTMFGVSSLATVSVEEIEKLAPGPKMFQFYFHKDRGLNDALLERARAANFQVMALTVDTITGGNRERDLRTGFTSPPRITPASAISYALHPGWAWNYFTKEKFDMPHLSGHVSAGTNLAMSIGDYFGSMLDQSMNWDDAEKLCAKWNGQFALKGIMSVEDAKRAVDIGCTGIMVSNHGGRQLDGSRAPFDQLAEICDAVGDKIDVICEGGIQRGTHVLKALSVGAKACSGGRMYLYALAAAGQAGVERVLGNMRTEIERDMKLMGVTSLDQLSRANLRYR
ncbi:alpha-hydroxy acid oxidase [Cognatishimia maritima]|uniref:L-lactate dehydrogenase (Cytochrome) n=1 Tax=Cognatishimia maritima TaxID=870908 RepID=A0A1M5MTC5_9RHOB|nr:alpha-hydroxy acid oxidase [Cognatishimia maritima]SHG80630.1 L-lactate dehydrogenase (cytochrome) [Cognatishimia maritima]